MLRAALDGTGTRGTGLHNGPVCLKNIQLKRATYPLTTNSVCAQPWGARDVTRLHPWEAHGTAPSLREGCAWVRGNAAVPGPGPVPQIPPCSVRQPVTKTISGGCCAGKQALHTH